MKTNQSLVPLDWTRQLFQWKMGFLNKSKRCAFIAGKLEDLEAMGYTAGLVLDGQIVRIESYTPQYEGQSFKINPETKEAVRIDGQLVYFKDTYTEDLSAKDTLLKTSAIKTASGAVSVE